MLVTSIFYFSNNVFFICLKEDKNSNFRNIEIVIYNCFEFGPVQKIAFRKEMRLANTRNESINPLPQSPEF